MMVAARRARKDPATETLLRGINDDLLPAERRLEAAYDAPRFPVIFVLGTPRSGSTLVSLCLAHTGTVGYISNFVARFWKAPVFGARMEQALNIRREGSGGFDSEYGIAEGLASPHEFGYFWSRWFKFGQDTHQVSAEDLARVDVGAMRRSVAALEGFYEQPMSFKNNTWINFQTAFLAKVFPNAVFLVCRREPIYVAQSILVARRKLLGSEAHWWSVRPSTYQSLLRLPWWEQIAGQTVDIEREIDEGLKRVPARQVIDIPYRAFCERPAGLIESLRDRLSGLGFELAAGRPLPPAFAHTDERRIAEADWKLLEAALSRRAHSGPDRRGYSTKGDTWNSPT